MKQNLLSLLIVISLLVPVMSKAQEVSPEPTANTEETLPNTEGLIFERPTVADQIKDVKQTYRGQFESYRNSERQFQVAKGQFQQLNTLISLETAVKATRQVMLDRVTVMSTYLRLLKLQLIETTGVSLPLKEQTLAEIDVLLIDLQAHLEQIEKAQDRDSVNARADEFTAAMPEIEETAYQALTLITVGPFQTVYDKSRSLVDVLEVEAATASTAVKQPEKDRAFIQTSQTLDTVQFNLGEVLADINNPDRRFTRSNYSQITRDLQPIQSGLNQSIGFLLELLRI